MYARLEALDSGVFIPLKPQEVAAFKENAARCLDKIQAREYTSEKTSFLPASRWYTSRAKLVAKLPGIVEFRAGTPGYVCRHGYGYGTPVLQRQDGYALYA